MGEDLADTTSTSHLLEVSSFSTGVLVLLLLLWSLFGHELTARCRFLSEGSIACLMGLVSALCLLAFHKYLVNGVISELLQFDSANFFMYLLPPVIFYAGLSVERQLFLQNLPSILNFGVVGTMVSAAVIAAVLYALTGMHQLRLEECLALGAIFSATDSVATLQLLDSREMPQLFSLVFGEGVINDAVSVVLLGAVARSFPTPAGTAPRVTSTVQTGPATPATAAALSLINVTLAMANATSANITSFINATNTTIPPLPSPLPAPPLPPLVAPAIVDDKAQRQSLLGAGFLSSFLYLLGTSLGLGLAAGGAIAALLHRFKRHGPHHEVALIGLLAYGAYIAAEVLRLSGILTLFVCGLAVSHLALPAATPAGRAATQTAFQALSYVAEGFIFIFIGMDALDPVRWQVAHGGEALWLVLVLLLVLLVSRAMTVVPLSLLHNVYAAEQLKPRDILIIWWAGLMRGAVSVALVYYQFDLQGRALSGSSLTTVGLNPSPAERQRATLIVSTLIVVLISVLMVSAFTKPLLSLLLNQPERPLQDVLMEAAEPTIKWSRNVLEAAAAQRDRIAHYASAGGHEDRSGSSRGDEDGSGGSLTPHPTWQQAGNWQEQLAMWQLGWVRGSRRMHLGIQWMLFKLRIGPRPVAYSQLLAVDAFVPHTHGGTADATAMRPVTDTQGQHAAVALTVRGAPGGPRPTHGPLHLSHGSLHVSHSEGFALHGAVPENAYPHGTLSESHAMDPQGPGSGAAKIPWTHGSEPRQRSSSMGGAQAQEAITADTGTASRVSLDTPYEADDYYNKRLSCLKGNHPSTSGADTHTSGAQSPLLTELAMTPTTTSIPFKADTSSGSPSGGTTYTCGSPPATRGRMTHVQPHASAGTAAGSTVRARKAGQGGPFPDMPCSSGQAHGSVGPLGSGGGTGSSGSIGGIGRDGSTAAAGQGVLPSGPGSGGSGVAAGVQSRGAGWSLPALPIGSGAQRQGSGPQAQSGAGAGAGAGAGMGRARLLIQHQRKKSSGDLE